MTDSLSDAWMELTTPPSADTLLVVGQRVRLRPRAGGDVMDMALAGRLAVVESIAVTMDGDTYVAVTVDDDPGQDLGRARALGHRFFFRAAEVEPVEPSESVDARPRVLVAGIGNIFFGDDGFGVEVARRLARLPLPRGVTVHDFGIRGLDLAYALQDDVDVAVLIDAMCRGEAPGTITAIEPALDPAAAASIVDAHGLDPARVLSMARSLGRVPPRVIVVGCEPATTDLDDVGGASFVALSPPVLAAVDEAVRTVVSLVERITRPGPQPILVSPEVRACR